MLHDNPNDNDSGNHDDHCIANDHQNDNDHGCANTDLHHCPNNNSFIVDDSGSKRDSTESVDHVEDNFNNDFNCGLEHTHAHFRAEPASQRRSAVD